MSLASAAAMISPMGVNAGAVGSGVGSTTVGEVTGMLGAGVGSHRRPVTAAAAGDRGDRQRGNERQQQQSGSHFTLF